MSPLFSRKDKTTIAELEEYYANQKKRRTGTAWLMALISLIITIAVIVLLFLGGRWVYRTFIDNSDDNTESSSVEGDDISLPNFDSDELGSDRGVSFEEGSSNNPDDLVVGDSGSVSGGTVSDEAASTDIPNTDRLARNNEDGSVAGTNEDTDSEESTSTESNADSGKEIPDTGAGETALIALLAVTILGYYASRKFQLKG